MKCIRLHSDDILRFIASIDYNADPAYLNAVEKSNIVDNDSLCYDEVEDPHLLDQDIVEKLLYRFLNLKLAMLLLTLATGVIGFKYIVTCVILYLFKFDIHKSSSMAIALAQISEFGFVLASRAKQLDIISREIYYVLIAITSITLIATPLILKVTTKHTTAQTNNNNNDTNHHDLHHDVISIGLSTTEKLA